MAIQLRSKICVNIFNSIPKNAIPSHLKNKIVFSTWHTDLNPNLDEAAKYVLFREWTAGARLKKAIDSMQKYIEKERSGIFVLQKLGKCNTISGKVNSVKAVKNLLKEMGYEVYVRQYSNGKRSPSYLTAFDPKKYRMLHHESVYISKTPQEPLRREGLTIKEIKEQNYGLEYGRSVYVTLLSHLSSGKPVCVINVHLPLLQGKKEGLEVINKTAEKYVKLDPETAIIISGNFNSFTGEKSMDSIKSYLKLNDATKNILFPDKKFHNSTFLAPVYDLGTFKDTPNLNVEKINKNPKILREAVIKFFNENCDIKRGHLDHIFTFNMEPMGGLRAIPFPMFKDFKDHYNEKYLKKNTVKHAQETEKRGPIFASTHPLLTKTFFLNDE